MFKSSVSIQMDHNQKFVHNQNNNYSDDDDCFL